MRMIIDSNQLGSENLRHYLARSSKNIAVLTDYTAIEAYKSKSIDSMHKSMRIVSQFPRQVLVLKATVIIGGLSARGSGLQRRMIDQEQTEGFSKFCKHLDQATKNPLLWRPIFELQADAQSQMSKIESDTEGLRESILLVGSTLDQKDLAFLREREPPTDATLKKLSRLTSGLAFLLIEKHPTARHPSDSELYNAFLFRMALCFSLATFRWLGKGGIDSAKNERIRNDMVDCIFAAYATYFDGLMTNDKALIEIYRLAKLMIAAGKRRTQLSLGQ